MNKESSSDEPRQIETKWFHEFAKTLPSLQGKTIAITGCTTGTGYIAARTCIEKGADNVLLLNRTSERSERAEQMLNEFKMTVKNTTTNIETIACDLQDFDSVRQAANRIKDKYEAVDVLCNNAGVMALEDIATKDGYDIQMQTNHLSHFLLTKEVFPLLVRAKELQGEARIVQHSSGARRGFEPLKAEYLERRGGNLGGNGGNMWLGGAKWKRYHQTKLANAVFTLGLADRLVGSGIKAAVAAPGMAATNLQVTTNKTGGMYGAMWTMCFAQSAEDGSMPLLAACFDPSTENGDFWEPSKNGALIGPAVKVPYDRLSKDPESRILLWKKSEEACGTFEISI